MKLHLPTTLRAALLAAVLSAGCYPALGVTSTTTEYTYTPAGGTEQTITFNGDIWTWNNNTNNTDLSAYGNTYTNYSTNETVHGRDVEEGSFTNASFLYNFFNGSENDRVGNTLRFSGATSNIQLSTDWTSHVWIGGLITEASDNITYKFGRDTGSNFKLKGTGDVNLLLNSSFTLLTATSGGSSTVSVEKGGTWTVAGGKTFTITAGQTTLATDQVVNIKGGGTVDIGSALDIRSGSSINVAVGSTLTVSGTTTNAGTITLDGNLSLNGITSNGAITLNGSSTLTLGGVVYLGGQITNNAGIIVLRNGVEFRPTIGSGESLTYVGAESSTYAAKTDWHNLVTNVSNVEVEEGAEVPVKSVCAFSDMTFLNGSTLVIGNGQTVTSAPNIAAGASITLEVGAGHTGTWNAAQPAGNSAGSVSIVNVGESAHLTVGGANTARWAAFARGSGKTQTINLKRNSTLNTSVSLAGWQGGDAATVVNMESGSEWNIRSGNSDDCEYMNHTTINMENAVINIGSGKSLRVERNGNGQNVINVFANSGTSRITGEGSINMNNWNLTFGVAKRGSGAAENDPATTPTLSIEVAITGSHDIQKTGNSILELTNAGNIYTGGTTVSGGTLRLSGEKGKAGTGTITVAAGATLELAHSADCTTTNAITLNGNLLVSGVDETVTSALTLAEGQSMTIAKGASLTLTSALTNNGTITLNGALLLNSISGNGTIALGQGATLDWAEHYSNGDTLTVGKLTGVDDGNGIANFMANLSGRQRATYNKSEGEITISGFCATLQWKAGNGAWTASSEEVWTNTASGNADRFYDHDNVEFHGTAENKLVVTQQDTQRVNDMVLENTELTVTGNLTASRVDVGNGGATVAVSDGAHFSAETIEIAGGTGNSLTMAPSQDTAIGTLTMGNNTTLTVGGTGHALSVNSLTLGTGTRLIMGNEAGLTIGTQLASGIAANTFEAGAGSTLSIAGNYTTPAHFQAVLNSFTGEGTLKFTDAQTGVQPNGSAFAGNVENKKVVFDKGLAFNGWSQANEAQKFTVGSGTEVTVNNQALEARRVNVNVEGGKLTANAGILIGHPATDNTYPGWVNLRGGEIVTTSVKGQHNHVGSAFTMRGGTLTIAGEDAFGLTANTKMLEVNLRGGTIRTTAAQMNLSGNAESDHLVFEIGSVTFDTGEGHTINLNHDFTQTGTLTVTGSGTLNISGNVTLAGVTGLEVSGEVTYSDAVSHSEQNGYANASYIVVKGSGTVTNLNQVTLYGGGHALTESGGNRVVTLRGTAGLYYVREGTVEYGGTGEKANNAASADTTGIVLDGGSLTMQQNLAERVNITLSAAGTVSLGQNVTLSGDRVIRNGHKLTLGGTGKYVHQSAVGDFSLSNYGFSSDWDGTVELQAKTSLMNLSADTPASYKGTMILNFSGHIQIGINSATTNSIFGENTHLVLNAGTADHAMILQRQYAGENNALTLASLSSGANGTAVSYIRGDMGDSSAGYRYLKVRQDIDTTFAGIFYQKTSEKTRDVGLIKEGTGNLTLTNNSTSGAPLKVSGGTLTLKDKGNWAGAITVKAAGTLAFHGANKEIAAGKSITFDEGATLAVTGGSLTVRKALSVTNLALSGGGTMTVAENLTVGGMIFMDNNNTMTIATGKTLTHDGFTYTAGSADGSISKTGDSTTGDGNEHANIVSALYSENTTVSGVTMTKTATGDKTVNFALDNVHFINRNDTTTLNHVGNRLSALEISGGAVELGADATTAGLMGTANGTVKAVGGARTLTIDQSTDTTFAGSIANGDTEADVLGITKQGTGTLTLSGENTYIGSTTVTGGTLKVTGTIGNTSSVAVSGDGALEISADNGASVTVGSITARANSGEGHTAKNVTVDARGITGAPAGEGDALKVLGELSGLTLAFAAESTAAAISNVTMRDVTLSGGAVTMNGVVAIASSVAGQSEPAPARTMALSVDAQTRAAADTQTLTATPVKTGGSVSGKLTVDIDGSILAPNAGKTLSWTIFDRVSLADGASFTLKLGDVLKTIVENGKPTVTLSGDWVNNDEHSVVLTAGDLGKLSTDSLITGNLLAASVDAGSLVLTIENIPEPATATLSLLALAALAARRRRK